jgi:hypothetical protein
MKKGFFNVSCIKLQNITEDNITNFKGKKLQVIPNEGKIKIGDLLIKLPGAPKITSTKKDLLISKECFDESTPFSNINDKISHSDDDAFFIKLKSNEIGILLKNLKEEIIEEEKILEIPVIWCEKCMCTHEPPAH